jgi:hypothetical protein
MTIRVSIGAAFAVVGIRAATVIMALLRGFAIASLLAEKHRVFLDLGHASNEMPQATT